MRRCFTTGTLLALLTALPAAASETVNLSVPASLSFTVSNVSSSTDAAEFDISFSSGALTAGHKLKMSVQAASSTFTPPHSGGTISASTVSWSSTGASGGTGYDGTLSSSSYVTLYQSNASLHRATST